MPRLKQTLLLLALLNSVLPTNAHAMGLLVGILGAPGTGMAHGPWSKGGNPAPITESPAGTSVSAPPASAGPGADSAAPSVGTPAATDMTAATGTRQR